MKMYLWAIILLILVVPGAALAQTDGASAEPITASLRGVHDLTSANILRAAEMLDEDVYAYRPTDEVRTAGQILAHLASSQYMFCSAAAGEESPSRTNFEEEATTKAEITAALQQALEYCSSVYERMTDEEAAQARQIFGQNLTASGILAFNTAHNYEHYGNLVTYMRMNGIVPPSSM